MAYIRLSDALAIQALRTEYVFRDRTDLFDEMDEWLLSCFRLPRVLLLDLCNTLEPQLRRNTCRSNPQLHFRDRVTAGVVSRPSEQQSDCLETMASRHFPSLPWLNILVSAPIYISQLLSDSVIHRSVTKRSICQACFQHDTINMASQFHCFACHNS